VVGPRAPPRLYVPHRNRSGLTDPTRLLLITEGEKQALKADQEGLACVAIGGLWNWRAGGEPARSTAPTSPGEGGTRARCF
jgi:hypothetical protein